MFLDGDDKVIEDYRTGGAAPYFFILDKGQVVNSLTKIDVISRASVSYTHL